MAEHLCDDLIDDILCRLPIKDLVSCKLVSKDWNRVISVVCVPRISRCINPPSGFLFRAGMVSDVKKRFNDYLSYRELPVNKYEKFKFALRDKPFVESYSRLLPSEYSPYYVPSISNGLILFMSSSSPRYFVCNPATKQCVAIPIFSEHVNLHDAALVFDPRESLHYKVYSFVKREAKLDIFSSETRTWIRHNLVVKPSEATGVEWFICTVYLKGMLYKLSRSKHLLCISCETLTVNAIEVPIKDQTDTFGFIGVSKDVLYYSNFDGVMILIWQFDYHGGSDCLWTLKHSLPIRYLKNQTMSGWAFYKFRKSHLFKIYAIHPTLDNIIFIGFPTLLFEYNLESHKLVVLCARGKEEGFVWGQYFLHLYSPCYVILEDISETSSNSSKE